MDRLRVYLASHNG
ncbi:unnamed protein product, partial [Didymodactylos carnosus]